MRAAHWMTACTLWSVATAAFGGVVWKGNFETGDLTQWSGTQMVSPDRLAVTQDPVREGHYAMRALVKQGDNPINASGNRNELFYLSYEPNGSEYFYKWSVMFDPSFPSVATWQLFTQWHQQADTGSPPVEFYVNGEQLRLRIGGDAGSIVWTNPLIRGQWLDFVFHVKWSADPAVGFVELYFNGNRVVPLTHIATGYGNYLKQGLYRDASVTADGILYLDGTTQATTLADVMPPPSPASDAGTPSPPDGGSGAGTSPPSLSNGPPSGTPPSPDHASVTGGTGCSSLGEASLWGLGVLGLLARVHRKRRLNP